MRHHVRQDMRQDLRHDMRQDLRQRTGQDPPPQTPRRTSAASRENEAGGATGQRDGQRPDRAGSATRSTDPRLRVGGRRQRIVYGVMMGTCLLLVIVAWSAVRVVSVPAAIAMSVVAAVIPPLAAIMANAPEDRPPEDEPSQRRPPRD